MQLGHFTAFSFGHQSPFADWTFLREKENIALARNCPEIAIGSLWGILVLIMVMAMVNKYQLWSSRINKYTMQWNAVAFKIWFYFSWTQKNNNIDNDYDDTVDDEDDDDDDVDE